LVLLPHEVDLLEQLRKSHTAPRRAVQRAQVLWLYHREETIAAIMSAVHLTRKSVAKWVSKALKVGVAAGLQDTPHGSSPKLTEEAKTWVIHVACSKPKDFGCLPYREDIRPWPAIMSTNDWGRAPFWPLWICIRAT
jgi:hypothetical protein